MNAFSKMIYIDIRLKGWNDNILEIFTGGGAPGLKSVMLALR